MPSTHQVWQDVPDDPAFRSATLPASADVCVIGAGIAGLTTAYNLARAGKKVVVLEARSVGDSGMTALSTAQLANVIDDRFASLVKVRGEENTKLAAAAHAAAIDFVEETSKREGIDCRFARVDGYLYAATPSDDSTIDEEADAARKAGLTVEVMASFPEFKAGKAVRFLRQGRFEPMIYLAGLATAILKHGGTIVENARVTDVTDGSPCKVTTGDGRSLTAKAVVVATNSPVTNRVTIHTKQYPYTTYVVCLKAPTSALPDCIVWDTLDPYHYVRWAGNPGPDGRDVLIVGGEDHKTGHANDGEERFAKLEAWTREHVPAAGEVTHKWAGQVQETMDGLAYIGKNPGDTNVYIATGDSGMGTTHGTIAGILLPALINGESHPWAELFDPSRSPVRGLADRAMENADVALQYTAWVTGGDVGSVDEIKPGTGAVVRKGLSKVAVYRDEAGQVTACTAVCPHLGGILAWNGVERTWDCPVHGSRFDRDGRCKMGPAKADLDKVELG